MSVVIILENFKITEMKTLRFKIVYMSLLLFFKDYAKSAQHYDRAAVMGLTDAKECAAKARAAMTEKDN